MATLYFPVLTFHEGENVTLRMGSEWADWFGGGLLTADIKQLGHDELFAVADISRIEAIQFHMIQQTWIDEASYPGVINLDQLYDYMSLFYGTFDCEAVVSVIYFTLRP